MHHSHKYRLPLTTRGDVLMTAAAVVAEQGQISALSLSGAPVAAFLRRHDRWAGLLLAETVPRFPQSLELTVWSDSATAPTLEPLENALITPLTAEEQPVVLSQTLMALERSSVRGAPSDVSMRSCRYFNTLDTATNKALLNDSRMARSNIYADQLIDMIESTGKFLLDRLVAAATGDVDDSEEVPRLLLVTLSAIQVDAARRHFGDAMDSTGAVLQDAYALFGAGELFLDVYEPPGPSGHASNKIVERCSNGGPNGAFVFLFAEFALAAIEAEVDAAFWRRALPGLAAAAELFLFCYGADTSGAVRKQSFAGFPGRPTARLRSQDRLSILDSYRPLTLNAITKRLRWLARNAFSFVGPSLPPPTQVHSDAGPGGPNGVEFATLPTVAVPSSGICFKEGPATPPASDTPLQAHPAAT